MKSQHSHYCCDAHGTSELGHPRRFGDAGGTSAITPIATELLHCGNRRKGPTPDIALYIQNGNYMLVLSVGTAWAAGTLLWLHALFDLNYFRLESGRDGSVSARR